MTRKAATAAFDHIRTYATPSWRKLLFCAVVLILAGAGLYQLSVQSRENAYVSQIAHQVTAQAGAKDTTTKILALRDYVRLHVTRENFPARGRPFLRNTAVESLRSGKGRCGESTRAFINLADAVGVRAQRLYLEGRRRHVVALAKLDNGEQVIVDSSDKPYFQELESLTQLSNHPEFDSYSSFNERRTLASLRSKTVNLGRFAVYTENPHTLQAAFWFMLATGLIGLALLRRPLRALRARRKKLVRIPRNDWDATPAPSGSL